MFPLAPAGWFLCAALGGAAWRWRPCAPGFWPVWGALVGFVARRRLCSFPSLRCPGSRCAFGSWGGVGGCGRSGLTAPVGFSGSRSLSPAAASLAAAVARGVVASGAPGLVGCAAGADAAFVSAFVAGGAAARLRVFAAFGPGGVGAAGAASSVSGVAAAARAGASVCWWAGGPASVPVRGRLARRSLAFVRALAAAGGRLFVFPSSPPARPFASGAWPSCGSGSWASACAAARLGVPVVVFPGFAGPLPLLGAGAWASVSLAGSVGWAWRPAVVQSSLL